MHKLRIAVAAGTALVASAAAAGAQSRRPANVPPGQMPPAGMCRVWIDGVAPGRQPAPTDCATARTQLRANSHLVYGPALNTNGGVYNPNGTVSNGGDGGWKGRNGTNGTGNGGVWDRTGTRDDRDNRDGRFDGRMTDRQRREWEKEQRKREKERRKAHKHHGRRGHDDGDDDDDDDDDRGGRDARGSRGNGSILGGIGTQIPQTQPQAQPQSQPGSVWGAGGVLRRAGGCVDANRDGYCDGTTRRVP